VPVTHATNACVANLKTDKNDFLFLMALNEECHNYMHGLYCSLLNRCNNRFHPQLWQVFIIPHTINKLMDPRTYYLRLGSILLELINIWQFISFQLLNNLNLKKLGSDTNGSAVWYVFQSD
jgi:hypothetical protein